MHILSVSGPVVTAAGHGDQLAIVSHASDCLPSGDQVFISILICLEILYALCQSYLMDLSSHLSQSLLTIFLSELRTEMML